MEAPERSQQIRDAVERGDVEALASLEEGEPTDEPMLFSSARFAMALVPGVDAALRTVDVLLRRRLLERPPPDYVPPGMPDAAPGQVVRSKSGLPLHADWTARAYGAALAFRHVADADSVLEALLATWGAGAGAGVLRDLYACILHECVLRGADLRASKAAIRIAEMLAATKHPLGVLPVFRLSLEVGSEALASTYGLRVAGGWSSPGREADPAQDPVPPLPVAAALDDVTCAADAGITAAFGSHLLVSNGKSDGRVFALSAPCDGTVPIASIVHALASGGCAPACLRVAKEGALVVKPLEPALALQTLLAVASNGGDYNLAWSGAYGRLGAWRSLAGLVDVPASAPLHEVEARARRCRFAWFDAESPWFFHVVTDFGLATLREDGASIAVLAGTDTD